MINGSIIETSTTLTGLDGNYYGSMHNEHTYITPRSIHCGYKKLHEISSLILSLPNYIHYIFGPYSMQ